MIILDLGAGDATKNDSEYIEKIIDSIPQGDIVLKFQLFEDIPGLTPLKREVFAHAWVYGQKRGFKVTSSVFDSGSLYDLTTLDIPFVKIACNTDFYPLIDEVPQGIPILVSVDSHIQLISVATAHLNMPLFYMMCVPKYPAEVDDYVGNFSSELMHKGLSDHTKSLELFETFRPRIWERHYCIDPIGPDYEHAIGPEELTECLRITATD